MTVVKITLTRFLLSCLLIYLNWTFALGIDANFILAFVFCLMNEVAFSTISTFIFAGTKKKHFIVPGSHSDTVVKILEKELEKPYSSWSEIDPYLLINAVMKLNELGKIPKSTFLLTPHEITQILRVIDEVPEKRL
ncbi:hypothetical protein [Leptospira santarosai]|uniref:hypothetical protein n=1 Tax=Leptospira santarosai TaxID=28183 RepID=UPI0024AEF046|nr:hypothetical protein [Leptospira santarosai]MDI7200112.1 hypothetical protein [Leptospira santarosai]MDI7213762.1 hypothetical protein [Leptospira santarosai]